MLLTSALILAGSVAVPFRSLEEFQVWLANYYRKPQPELALPALPFVDRELGRLWGGSLAFETQRGGMRTAYAKIFEKNPALVREIDSTYPTWPESQRLFVKEALGRCAADLCRMAMGGTTPPSRGPADTASGALDDSVAAFFVTGDERYIREVIDVLHWSELADDVRRRQVGEAAWYILTTNAHQHGRVLAVCEKVAAEVGGPTRAMLDQIVALARSHRAQYPPPELQ